MRFGFVTTNEATRPCSETRADARQAVSKHALPLLQIDHLTGMRNGVHRDGITLDQR